MKPPMLVRLAKSAPPLSTIAGMMVWKGRLPPTSAFGCSGSRAKLEPRFCKLKPQPWGTIAVPKPQKFELTIETAQPAASTTWKLTVLLCCSGAPRCASAVALAGSIRARRAATYAGESSASVGTCTCSGSATNQRESAKARRSASISGWRCAAEPCAAEPTAGVRPSSIASAASAVRPCPLGAHSYTSTPW